MLREPRSYLWLLAPPSQHHGNDVQVENNNTKSSDSYGASHPVNVQQNLLAFADMWGVSRSRIFFAARVSKEEHILRHRAADLFLDTLEYSAHSTATDALRGVSLRSRFCMQICL
jgi:predicted O-linked N-acetylglucosamine transferase (SPINDLY family)